LHIQAACAAERQALSQIDERIPQHVLQHLCWTATQWSTCSTWKADVAFGDKQMSIMCQTCGMAGLLRKKIAAAAMSQVRLDVPSSGVLPTCACRVATLMLYVDGGYEKCLQSLCIPALLWCWLDDRAAEHSI
jgi:hypothetical protein